MNCHVNWLNLQLEWHLCNIPLLYTKWKISFWLIDISSSNSKFPWTTVYKTSFESHGKQTTYSGCDQKQPEHFVTHEGSRYPGCWSTGCFTSNVDLALVWKILHQLHLTTWLLSFWDRDYEARQLPHSMKLLFLGYYGLYFYAGMVPRCVLSRSLFLSPYFHERKT